MATHPMPSHIRLCTVALASVAALFLTSTCVHAAWYDNPIIDGNTWNYILFESNPNGGPTVDGPSGVGFLGFPSFVGAVTGNTEIALCDMYGSGSAVRRINASGIYTIAGSLTQKGNVDGFGQNALFGGINSGSIRVNGLTYINNLLYLADTLNNAIRVITREGMVATQVRNTSIVEGQRISGPVYVASYANSDVNLFISDRNNLRILSATVVNTADPSLAVLRTGFSPGPLAYSKSRSTLYYTMGTSPMSLGATSIGTVATSWFVGDASTLRYINSLALSDDENELLYYGNAVGGVFGVYAIRVDSTIQQAPLQTPALKFPWPANDPRGQITVLLPYGNNSYYVVTDRNAYVVSVGGPLVIDSSSSSASSSMGSGNSNSGMSGSRSASSSGSSGSGGGGGSSSSSSGWNIYTGRQHGIAAFPMSAFPANDTCLMSQLYYHIRMDAEVAYKTSDYYTQFAPLNDTDMAIKGDINVSSWCSNITSRVSNDGSISILDFWGPIGLSLYYTQKALTDSPWTNTRRFLDGLIRQGWDLGPFCFYNCTTRCETAHADDKLCIDYQKCDDVCRGAIASSVVMACAGIVLIVLMAVSPANVFTALIMVPLI